MKEKKENLDFGNVELPRETRGSELEEIIRGAAERNGYRVTTTREYNKERKMSAEGVKTETVYLWTFANVTGLFTKLKIKYYDRREEEKSASFIPDRQKKINIASDGRDIRSLFTTEKKKREFLEAIAQEYKRYEDQRFSSSDSESDGNYQ